MVTSFASKKSISLLYIPVCGLPSPEVAQMRRIRRAPSLAAPPHEPERDRPPFPGAGRRRHAPRTTTWGCA